MDVARFSKKKIRIKDLIKVENHIERKQQNGGLFKTRGVGRDIIIVILRNTVFMAYFPLLAMRGGLF